LGDTGRLLSDECPGDAAKRRRAGDAESSSDPARGPHPSHPCRFRVPPGEVGDRHEPGAGVPQSGDDPRQGAGDRLRPGVEQHDGAVPTGQATLHDDPFDLVGRSIGLPILAVDVGSDVPEAVPMERPEDPGIIGSRTARAPEPWTRVESRRRLDRRGGRHDVLLQRPSVQDRERGVVVRVTAEEMTGGSHSPGRLRVGQSPTTLEEEGSPDALMVEDIEDLVVSLGSTPRSIRMLRIERQGHPQHGRSIVAACR
jgi:hypothetical protein